MRKCLLLLIMIFFGLLFQLPVKAELTQESAVTPPELPVGIEPLKEIEVSGPYCGIYSLIAVFDTYGIQPKIEELLVPEYVGSFQGSSNVELVKAAEKYGLYGKSYANLTWEQLKTVESPMILHFRSSFADSKFNHWVTFLGVEGSFARVIDLPHDIAFVPSAELLAQWDGSAIEISNKPINNDLTIASKFGNLTALFVFLAIGAFCVFFGSVPTNLSPPRRSPYG